jgi:prevent-host-death family protein
MRAKRGGSVGIRELKDQASSIIEQVRRSGSSLAVTRNNKEVARIVPVTQASIEDLVASGLFTAPPRASWREMVLEPLGTDASAAIAAIQTDRGA